MLIYRWYPHGSKNLSDLIPLHSYRNLTELQHQTMPMIVFHDQEPLNYELYQSIPLHLSPNPNVSFLWHCFDGDSVFHDLVNNMPRIRKRTEHPFNINDKILLCHSEKNSSELSKYAEEFVGVYYWAHAVIARDWFRFAQHDQGLDQLDYRYDFLIYNRAWTGTREYRLKFSELLVESGLHKKSLTSFSSIDSGIDYKLHKFTNKQFQILNFELDQNFLPNSSLASASADYVTNDYRQTRIEIVLETLFDDSRLHLTEKTLRPIACGKPFMLASTPGSLQYLKDYGFKTFEPFIDESYDQIVDPVKRMQFIINEMQRFSQLPDNDKIDYLIQMNKIAKFNRDLFFSASWQNSIYTEFLTNLSSAVDHCNQHQTGKLLREYVKICNANSYSVTEFNKKLVATLTQ